MIEINSQRRRALDPLDSPARLPIPASAAAPVFVPAELSIISAASSFSSFASTRSSFEDDLSPVMLQRLPVATGVYPNAQPYQLKALDGQQSAKPAHFLPTLLVADSGTRYLRASRMARGGFGKVYPVVREDGEVFAAKIYRLSTRQQFSTTFNGQSPNKERATHVSSVRSIAQENAALDEVGSSLRTLDQGEGRGRHFVIMPMMETSVLSLIISAHRQSPTNPSLLRHLAFGTLAAGSLALSTGAGKDFIHRDIKPENFLVGADGSIHLADWGLARRLDAISLNVKGGSGTRVYQAPEAISHKTTEKASDTYSLALTISEVATGHNPLRLIEKSDRKATSQQLAILQMSLSQWTENTPRLGCMPEQRLDFPAIQRRKNKDRSLSGSSPRTVYHQKLDSWSLRLRAVLGDTHASDLITDMLAFHTALRPPPEFIAHRYGHLHQDHDTMSAVRGLLASSKNGQHGIQKEVDDLASTWQELSMEDLTAPDSDGSEQDIFAKFLSEV